VTGRLADHLDNEERGRLLAAMEHAADRLGLGIFAARVDVSPPRIVHMSALAAEILGRSAETAIGRPPWEIMPLGDQSGLQQIIASREGEAAPLFLEFFVERPDGVRIPVEVGVARVRVADALLAVGYFRDVRDRRAALEALQRSESRFRSLVENAPDGVVILRGTRISFMNSAAARLLRVESPAKGLGQDIRSFLPEAAAARAGERIAAMFREGAEYPPSEYAFHDGRTVEIKSIKVDHEGAPAVLAFARDVTERKAIQRELVRSDRLAAVGTLAAAVAHEINNPLTYAQLSLQLVERELLQGDVSPARIASMLDHVRNARHGAERVATIVRDLRTFARVDETAPGPVDVAAVVDHAIKIAENDLRHRARLVRRYHEVPPVDGNASRLEQVFLNLLINALQALPDGDPTRDEIAVEIARRGGDVVVSVRDTGCGVPAAVRDRIFDPFFTTKPVGEGTGLGLSVCRSILESLGGRIELESTEGKGTTVTVHLRAHVGGERRATITRPPPPPADAEPRRLRVLVVDDEALVRRVLTMVLARHHDVEQAASGEEAMALLDKASFDVILCDLMMPGMSGMDVYERIRARQPGLEERIVFITGGAFVPRLADFLDSVDNLKLLKPFDVEQVLNAVLAAVER
jgi:two-component system, cell cycle sensor histidine kinase and response regulator CckA